MFIGDLKREQLYKSQQTQIQIKRKNPNDEKNQQSLKNLRLYEAKNILHEIKHSEKCYFHTWRKCVPYMEENNLNTTAAFLSEIRGQEIVK